jgi:mRNA-degrading endonuclease RelE of RelBE toxin-antitoxin system
MIREKINEWIKDFKEYDHLPDSFQQQLEQIADESDNEIKRLKDIIANTTHGRRKIKQDTIINTEIYTVKEDDYVYIYDLEKVKRVVADDKEEFYDNMIRLSVANSLLDKKVAVRVPHQMNYANTKYCVIEGNVVSYQIQGDREDGSFHDWMHMWIPMPADGKYVMLGVRLLGNDRYGDRIFLGTNHYKSEESWEGCYLSKNLRNPGSYKSYVNSMVEAYRTLTNREEFLLKK